MNLESECAAGGFEMRETDLVNEKRVYRYYCRTRPPMIGGLPHASILLDCEAFEERQYIPEIDCMAWGWIEYDHPLNATDIADYELISVPREV